jgi:hypothetical protein
VPTKGRLLTECSRAHLPVILVKHNDVAAVMVTVRLLLLL